MSSNFAKNLGLGNKHLRISFFLIFAKRVKKAALAMRLMLTLNRAIRENRAQLTFAIMKALLLTTALALLAASGFAQGTITFNNSVATLVTTNNGTTTGVALAGSAPRVVLYYSTAAVAPAVSMIDLTGWTLTTPTTPDQVNAPAIPTTAGIFSGGTQTADAAAPGANVWLMVRGWTGGFGDWASAYNSVILGGSTTFLGLTAPWQQTTGGTGAPPGPPTLMALGAGGFNGLLLTPPLSITPEPSTFALGGLGAIAAVYFKFRRKKARK